MKIEVVVLDRQDFILNYKHFHISPPRYSVALQAIKEYIDNELPKEETYKITMKKWKDKI